MNADDFEKQLERVPLREAPGHWRGQILNACQRAAASAAQPEIKRTASPLSSTPNHYPTWWRELLWPCPQAWAGVAAVWMLIFGLHLVAGSEPRSAVQFTSVPVSPELQALLAEQRRLFTELLPLPEAPPSRRRDEPADRPRSSIRSGSSLKANNLNIKESPVGAVCHVPCRSYRSLESAVV